MLIQSQPFSPLNYPGKVAGLNLKPAKKNQNDEGEKVSALIRVRAIRLSNNRNGAGLLSRFPTGSRGPLRFSCRTRVERLIVRERRPAPAAIRFD